MHRLFAGLPIPDDIADQLDLIHTDIPGVRWRQRRHYHLTLSFFGEVNRDMAEMIADMLETISSPPLKLELAGVGWFGRREPRALYARIASDDALEALAKACRRIGTRMKLKPDDHGFVPHITVAYCKDAPLPAIQDWSEQFQALRSLPFWADRLHLYESFTTPGRQSRYEIQADYALHG